MNNTWYLFIAPLYFFISIAAASLFSLSALSPTLTFITGGFDWDWEIFFSKFWIIFLWDKRIFFNSVNSDFWLLTIGATFFCCLIDSWTFCSKFLAIESTFAASEIEDNTLRLSWDSFLNFVNNFIISSVFETILFSFFTISTCLCWLLTLCTCLCITLIVLLVGSSLITFSLSSLDCLTILDSCGWERTAFLGLYKSPYFCSYIFLFWLTI